MLYWVVKGVLTPLLRVLYRVKVEGRQNIPRTGPVILAANHRSFLDSIFLPLVLRRRVTFVAKAEYFDDPKTAWFFRGVGQIPIRREGGSASERALESAAEVLQAGGVFAIYPEGTRTRDGYLHRGHTGVARLALRCGAPIVPVGMIGTDEIQPVDRKLPLVFRTVGIRFGRPLDLSRFDGAADDRLALRAIADEIMFEVQDLSGYEYVDTYMTRSADDAAAEPARVVTLAEARTPEAVAS
ncbi:MAG: 1-acyl-sn-glycerol-3-phosphate acyltransferase [Acidimicrobiia bacterium]|nr:1-acyl-sn-glycerol-3-phosphate acyltransferase [Acidimicrobiia bacterium]